MSTPVMNTRAAAKLLGVKDSHLYSLIRLNAIPSPGRDAGHRLVWRAPDIEAARQVLAQRQPATTT